MNSKDLQECSDLDLILTYQNNKYTKAPQILLERYNKIIYSYALKTFKKVASEYSVEVDDLVNDYREQCLYAFQKVDKTRIKKNKKFNTIGVILNRFNAYYKVIRKQYSYGYNMEHFEYHEEKTDFPTNYYYGSDLSIHNSQKKGVGNSSIFQIENHNVRLSINEFYLSLKGNIDKKCFKLLKLGYKGYEIAEKLHLSNSTVSNIKTDLKSKFKKFLDIK